MAASSEHSIIAFPVKPLLTEPELELYEIITSHPNLRGKVKIQGPILRSLAYRRLVSLGYLKIPEPTFRSDWFLECAESQLRDMIVELCHVLDYKMENPTKMVSNDGFYVHIFDSYPLSDYYITLTDDQLQLRKGMKRFVEVFSSKKIVVKASRLTKVPGQERKHQFLLDMIDDFRRAGWRFIASCKAKVDFELEGESSSWGDFPRHPDPTCKCHNVPCPPFNEVYADVRRHAASSELYATAMQILAQDYFYELSNTTLTFSAIRVGLQQKLNVASYNDRRTLPFIIKSTFDLEKVLEAIPKYKNINFSD